MKQIFLDIETIPSQIPSVREAIDANAQSEIAALVVPKSYTKPDVVAEWLQKNKSEILADAQTKYEKCSFDGAANHIVCIGLQIEGLQPVTFAGEGVDAIADEVLLLKAFFGYLGTHISEVRDAPVWIGHNVIAFDLKIIKQRSMVLGIKPPACIPFNAKPWDLSPFDTMAQWDQKNSVSLDKICNAFGFDGKGEVSGKDVFPMWKAGKLKEICEYCADDVVLTRKVYKRMTYQSNEEVV